MPSAGANNLGRKGAAALVGLRLSTRHQAGPTMSGGFKETARLQKNLRGPARVTKTSKRLARRSPRLPRNRAMAARPLLFQLGHAKKSFRAGGRFLRIELERLAEFTGDSITHLPCTFFRTLVMQGFAQRMERIWKGCLEGGSVFRWL